MTRMSTEALARPEPSIARHFAIALLWLPYNMQWGAFLSIAWPAQIQAVAAPDKEFWNGVLLGLGAAVSLVVTPLAGAASDRLRGRWGRRKPFLLAGGLANIAALLFLGTVGAGGTLTDFALGLLALQVGANLWGGPYAALIPDLIPPSRTGVASGCMLLMTAFGLGAGAALASTLTSGGQFFRLYAIIALVLALALAFTLMTISEPTIPAMPRATRRFFPSLAGHPDFYWVLATRALVGMGAFSVTTYLLYYLQSVAGLDDDAAKRLQFELMLGGGGVGLLAGLWAAWHSDRIGRKWFVMFSSAVMAVSSVLYLGGAADPALWLIWSSALLFGVGSQIYAAVDWGLALDVLPAGTDAGKDMGIWHASLVLPQIFGPPLSAFVLTSLKSYPASVGYTAIFALSAFWFVLGSVLVSRVRLR